MSQNFSQSESSLVSRHSQQVEAFILTKKFGQSHTSSGSRQWPQEGYKKLGDRISQSEKKTLKRHKTSRERPVMRFSFQPIKFSMQISKSQGSFQPFPKQIRTFVHLSTRPKQRHTHPPKMVEMEPANHICYRTLVRLNRLQSIRRQARRN